MEQNHLTLKKSTKAIIVVCITFIWLLFNWTSILNSIGTWYAKGDILPQDYKMAVKFLFLCFKVSHYRYYRACRYGEGVQVVLSCVLQVLVYGGYIHLALSALVQS